MWQSALRLALYSVVKLWGKKPIHLKLLLWILLEEERGGEEGKGGGGGEEGGGGGEGREGEGGGEGGGGGGERRRGRRRIVPTQRASVSLQELSTARVCSFPSLS